MMTQTTIAGRYRVLRQVGRGSFADTFAAESIEDGKTVLIKSLRLSSATDWKAVELFDREAKILAQLVHPGIPRFVEQLHEETDSGPEHHIVQELVPGRTLQERRAMGWRPSESTMTDIARQLLGILVYLHSHNPPIVHRDLKPENILCTDDDRVYLVDFGAAAIRALANGEAGSTVVGTFGYMAPEQLQGRACPQSDLFALAATLLACWAGLEPDQLPRDGLRINLRQAKLSRRWATFLGWLLEPAAEDRPPSAERALEALLGRRGRRPWVWPGVAVSLLAAALIAALLLSRPRPAPQDVATASVRHAAGVELAGVMRAITIAQMAFLADTDGFSSIAPQGAGSAKPAPWELARCKSTCSYRDIKSCDQYTCIGVGPPREGSYYRYACTTATDEGGRESHLTCAAVADLDGDGESKMFIMVLSPRHPDSRIVAPIPSIGDSGRCALGDRITPREVIDCDPDEI